MAHVKRSADARRDLIEIWLFIADDSVAAADRLADRFDTRARQLADAPMTGRPRDEFAPGLRSTVVGNYVLFYRPNAGGIELVRVLHGARNLRRIFGRSSRRTE